LTVEDGTAHGPEMPSAGADLGPFQAARDLPEAGGESVGSVPIPSGWRVASARPRQESEPGATSQVSSEPRRAAPPAFVGWRGRTSAGWRVDGFGEPVLDLGAFPFLR